MHNLRVAGFLHKFIYVGIVVKFRCVTFAEADEQAARLGDFIFPFAYSELYIKPFFKPQAAESFCKRIVKTFRNKITYRESRYRVNCKRGGGTAEYTYENINRRQRVYRGKNYVCAEYKSYCGGYCNNIIAEHSYFSESVSVVYSSGFP